MFDARRYTFATYCGLFLGVTVSNRTQCIVGVLVFASLGTLLTAGSLRNGFTTDDHFMRAVFKGFPGLEMMQRGPLATFVFSKGDAQEIAALRDKGVFPWWVAPAARLAFFRPLASASHWIDHRLWPDQPRPAHMHNLLWYALLCGVAFLMYRAYMNDSWPAWLAAFLYAVNESNGQAVGWIASRNTLMVAVASAAVLLAHHRWRTTRKDYWAIVAIAFYGVGLLCGEGAISVCAYLFAYAVFMEHGNYTPRIASLVPYALISVVYLALHRYFGFGTDGSAWYADPGADPARWLQMVSTNAPILLFTEGFFYPIFLGSGSRVQRYFLFSVMILVLLLVGLALRPLLRENPRARFWLLGAVLSLVPVSSVVVQPRVLTISALGGMALIAEFLAGWFGVRQFRRLVVVLALMSFAVRAVDTILRPGLLLYPVLVGLLVWVLYWVVRKGERSTPWTNLPAWPKTAGVALLCAWVTCHLIYAPNALPNVSMAQGAAGRKDRALFATLPADPSIPEKTLVLLQSQDDFNSYYFALGRSADVQPLPGRLRVLSASLRPLTIERPDERTLILRPSDGFVAQRDLSVYRSRKYPMHEGEVVNLAGMTVTVTKVDEAGWPMEGRFEFDQSLDAPSFVFYTAGQVEEPHPTTKRLVRVVKYLPASVPRVGETVTVDELRLRAEQAANADADSAVSPAGP